MRPWRRVVARPFGWSAPYWDSRVALPLDIEESEGEYVIKASVPGFAPQEIEIEVEDGVLSIRAEHEGEDEQEREDWYLRERFSGAVERRLRLGKDVNSEEIEAHLEHGVLTLTLPKVEQAKPKLIAVKAA
jgi:HSP20 family protein